MSDAPRTPDLTFTIERWAPTALNVDLRRHWTAREADRQDIEKRLLVALPPGQRRMKSPKMARLDIHVRRPQTLDADSKYGAVKILVDVLKDRGIIGDDRDDVLDLKVTQEVGSPSETRCSVWRA